MFGKPNSHQAITALAHQLVRLSESVDARFIKGRDLFQDIIKSQQADMVAVSEVLGGKIYDVISSTNERFEALGSALEGVKIQKSELLGEMTKEAERRDAKFTRIDAAIAAIEERLERLDAKFTRIDAAMAAIEKRLEHLDAKFTRIDVTISAIEKRPERLETGGKQPLDTSWSASIVDTQGLDVVYKDSKGDKTRRVIIPRLVSGVVMNGRRRINRIEAICTLRHKLQTFKLSSIQEAFDAATGEEVDAAAWLMERLKS